LRGEQPLWDADQHPSAWRWWTSRTKIFGLEKDIRFKFAFLNICPYHSKNFVDVSILASLPSCRTTIAWAQEILFREAERGERVVICMRSARYWGLREGTMRTSLFAPRVTRGGHMLTGERAAIVEAVRGAMEKA
jgi:hypothetical protein